MAVFNAAFPILPGKEEAARAFADELIGARRHDLDELERRCGVDREVWTLQHAPDGPLLLVYFEGDADATFTELATGTDEFTTWYRSQVLGIAGLDLARDEQPPAEAVLDWRAS